jgi:hypothetical protein
MAQASWLVQGARSQRSIITAPGATDVDDAVVRVDAALDGFPGPVPRWFRGLERVGRWWYVVCLAVTVPVAIAVAPADMAWRVAAGLSSGLILAPLSGMILHQMAKLHSRVGGSPSTQESLARTTDAARPAPGTVVQQAESILRTDPHLEPTVHRLSWRAAEPATSDGQTAAMELFSLWQEVDPRAAAAQVAEIEQIRASIRELKEQGKL